MRVIKIERDIRDILCISNKNTIFVDKIIDIKFNRIV